jgi:DNA excision repair protein ERCC-3
MNLNELNKQREELLKVQKIAQDSLDKLSILEREIKQTDKEIQSVADSIEKGLKDSIEKDKFIKFFEKPYTLIPQNKNKVLVVVPKFIKGFQVGWLWKEEENYFIYQLDQYSSWLGDVPQELLNSIDFKKEFSAEIIENQVFFNVGEKEIIKKALGKHLADIQDTSARIVKGHEFDILADMIERGNLPFKPKPVDKSDLRECKGSIELRSYQKPAFDKFLETGAIGLFHPTGAGKSMISLKAIDSLKGKKLVVVPTRTLVEQWEWYIEKYVPHIKNEIRIVTYQGFRSQIDEEFVLVIFDECHKLPADTFSRLAVIKAKYRIGLSASPHREDGRESYIFALTGFPVGLNWQEYMQTVGKSYHPIYVHVVRGDASKISKVQELLNYKKKTLIFSDNIELGKKISSQMNIPFIYGETQNRIETIEKNQVNVVSRVADLGLSIKNLNHVIEVDFLFGSRQQELQRTGRLMHSEEKDVRHDIIMTENEFSQYGKRLWALQEKGFTIKVVS